MPFTVTALCTPIRIYKLNYPLYCPNVLCQTSIHNEYTIYKYSDKDDIVFESLSSSFDPRLYNAFSIHEDCPGIDHCGIVHYLSGLFSKANIPLLYVNTYSYNLIFISEECTEKAISIMKNNPNLVYE
jgi:hypothetical protein